MFGKLRRTDFLLVGEPDPDGEQLEREADPASDDSDDEYADGLALREVSGLNCGESDWEECEDPEGARDLVVRGDIVRDFDEDPAAGMVGCSSFGEGLPLAAVDMTDFC